MPPKKRGTDTVGIDGVVHANLTPRRARGLVLKALISDARAIWWDRTKPAKKVKRKERA
jgi:hypothetical protein